MSKRANSTGHVPRIDSGTIESKAVRSVSMTILGQPASLKNSRRLVPTKNGKHRSIKSEESEKYLEDFARQVPPEYRNLGLGSLKEPLTMIVTVFYSSRRSDLDCSAIMDGLQASGVIANDRFIIEQHLYAAVDAENPRAEIIVEEM